MKDESLHIELDTSSPPLPLKSRRILRASVVDEGSVTIIRNLEAVNLKGLVLSSSTAYLTLTMALSLRILNKVGREGRVFINVEVSDDDGRYSSNQVLGDLLMKTSVFFTHKRGFGPYIFAKNSYFSSMYDPIAEENCILYSAVLPSFAVEPCLRSILSGEETPRPKEFISSTRRFRRYYYSWINFDTNFMEFWIDERLRGKSILTQPRHIKEEALLAHHTAKYLSLVGVKVVYKTAEQMLGLTYQPNMNFESISQIRSWKNRVTQSVVNSMVKSPLYA